MSAASETLQTSVKAPVSPAAAYERVAVVCASLGVAALTAAGWLIWFPLALIVAGVALLAVARLAVKAAVPAPLSKRETAPRRIA